MRGSTLALTALLAAACSTDRRDETPAAPTVSEAESTLRPALPVGLEHASEEYVSQWGRHWPSFRFQGVAAVVDDGQPVVVKAGGYRDLALALPHDAGSRFNLGTLSTHLTAVTVVRMAQTGDIDVNASVDRYLPEFPRGEDITVEQLLTHTAGLPSFTDPNMLGERAWRRMRGKDHVELLEEFAGDELQFEPGTDFAPSNSNYAVLGRIIEVVEDESYEAVVQRRVLDPLKMANTTFGEADSMHSIGLSFVEGGQLGAHLKPLPGLRPRGGGAALGWISTVADLGRLYHGLLDPEFVAPAARNRMLGQNPLSLPYAMVQTTLADRTAYAFKGLIDGHNSAVLWIPSEDRVAIALCNSEIVPGDAITSNLARLAYGLPAETREEARPVPESIEVTRRMAGTWMLTNKDRDRLTAAVEPEVVRQLLRAAVVANERHVSLRMGMSARQFYPRGDGQYFFKDRPQSQARFVAGPNPDQDRLVLIRDGVEIRYRRQPVATAAL